MFSLATAPIGYYSLSDQAAKNLTSFLLRTDPAIEAHYMQVTSITGEMVTTGKIQSTNLNPTGTTYTTEGTFFDLDNGAIKSKSFAIDSSGNANFKGDLSGSNISGATGTFTGTVQVGGTNLTAANTLNENNPTTVLYTFNGSTSIPTNTNSGSASTFTFTSDREGTARIRLVINDAEATGTYPNYYGIQASVNGTKLLTRLNIYDQGLADGSDGTFFDTVQVVSGSNNIKIWSNSGDGGTTKEIEVIYTQTEDITSGSAGGWTIDSSAIFSGTKDTNTFSTNGITFSSANGGSIHAEQFYIDTNGNAFFKGDLSGSNISGATGTFTGTVQVGSTDLTVANTLNTEDPMSAGSVVFNPNFLQVAADGRPAGAKAVYGSATQSTISYFGSAADGVLKIASTDTTTGVGFNAFPINPGAKYKFAIRLKQSSAASSGLYIRVAEKDSELSLGKTHLSSNGTGESGVEQGDRAVQTNTGNSSTGVGRLTNVTSLDHLGATTNLSSLENIAVTTSYRVIQGIYTPNSTAKYASFYILNWSGAGTSEMHIDRVYVSETTEDLYTGTIGGWNIDNEAIFTGTKDYDGFTGGGVTLWADGAIHSKNFYISSSGDAFFRGNISGSTGEFSGEVKGGIVTGSQVIGGTISGGTIIGATINVPDQNNPLFSVSSDGIMSATDAVISGSITANDGTLGSWVIDSVAQGGNLRDEDSRIILEAEEKKIKLFNSSGDLKAQINADDSFTAIGAGNVSVSGIGSSVAAPTAPVSSNSSQTLTFGTEKYSTTSNVFNITQAGEYEIEHLYDSAPFQIDISHVTSSMSSVSVYTSSPSGYFDGNDFNYYQSQAISKEAYQYLYLQIVRDSDDVVIKEIFIGYHRVTSGYAVNNYYVWNFVNQSWSYTSGYSAGPSQYRSTPPSGGIIGSVNFTTTGNHYARYMTKAGSRSGYSKQLRGYDDPYAFPEEGLISYPTVPSWTGYSQTYMDGGFTLLQPSNFVEFSGGGFQAVTNSDQYAKIKRNSAGYASRSIIEVKGGYIDVDQSETPSYTALRTKGRNYLYGQNQFGTAFHMSYYQDLYGKAYNDMYLTVQEYSTYSTGGSSSSPRFLNPLTHAAFVLGYGGTSSLYNYYELPHYQFNNSNSVPYREKLTDQSGTDFDMSDIPYFATVWLFNRNYDNTLYIAGFSGRSDDNGWYSLEGGKCVQCMWMGNMTLYHGTATRTTRTGRWIVVSESGTTNSW